MARCGTLRQTWSPRFEGKGYDIPRQIAGTLSTQSVMRYYEVCLPWRPPPKTLPTHPPDVCRKAMRIPLIARAKTVERHMIGSATIRSGKNKNSFADEPGIVLSALERPQVAALSMWVAGAQPLHSSRRLPESAVQRHAPA
jgi:hypothetical protein